MKLCFVCFAPFHCRMWSHSKRIVIDKHASYLSPVIDAPNIAKQNTAIYLLENNRHSLGPSAPPSHPPAGEVPNCRVNSRLHTRSPVGAANMPVNAWEHGIDHFTPDTSPSPSEQWASTPRSDLSQRSQSHSSATERRRGSMGPDLGSRRNGTVNILGTDSARESRRSSYSSFASSHQHVQPSAYEYRQGPLESPVINVTYDTANAVRDDSTLLGRWQCCECRRGHGVYRFEQGQHLISILACLCPHRSCKNCTFQGRIRRFAPIYDVEGSAMMPVAGYHGQGMYKGIVCRCCGLSWQAEKDEAPKRRKSFRQRLSILPKKVNPMSTLRHARSMVHLGIPQDSQSDDRRSGTALSISRSFMNLRSVSGSQAKETKPQTEPQAPGVQVRFYGIECTCGHATDERDICFVFLDLPKVKRVDAGRDQTGREVVQSPEPPYLPKLRAKGYGTPTLHLKGGAHPNPLMSNAVPDSEQL